MSSKNIEIQYNLAQRMIDSLDEGFLIIHRDGICGELVSLAAQKMLNRIPTGEHLADIINITDENRESFEDWLNMVFMEVIPFEDLAELAPKGLNLADQQKSIEIKFKPLRQGPKGEGGENKITEIVMILVDASSKVESEKNAGEQKLFTDMVVKYLNQKQSFIRLIQTTRETTDSLKSWAFNNMSDYKEQALVLSKELHQLKTELNAYSMYSLGYKVHQAEDEITTFSTINSNLQEGENLIHLMGQELDEALNVFLQKYRHIFALDDKAHPMKEVPVENIYKFCSELLRMGLTDLLKYYVNEIVAVPLSSLFAPIEARIYSQSLSEDRSIEFNISDPEKIRVIPEFYSLLFEQLTPVFNSIILPNLDTQECYRIHVSLNLLNENLNAVPVLQICLSNGQEIQLSSLEEQTTSDKLGLSSLTHSIQDMGGEIQYEVLPDLGTQIIIKVPYVSELNSDVMDWLNNSGVAAGNPPKAA